MFCLMMKQQVLLIQQINKTKPSLLERLVKISPLWASVLQRDENGKLYVPYVYDYRKHRGAKLSRIGEQEIDINFNNCCIAGEAHGFLSGYSRSNNSNYCEECDHLSYWLAGVDRNCMGPKGKAPPFETSLEIFLDHFEGVHLRK